MASSDTQITDSITVQVSPATRVPDRPGKSAQKPKWVDYVVALGADRAAVGGLTGPQLAELADRLEP